MKLGCIGYGNMATAILEGILKSGLLSPSDIQVYDHVDAQNNRATAKGLSVASSVKDLAVSSDFILVCVKPLDFAQLASTFSDVDMAGKTVISIVTGISLSMMSFTFGKSTSLVRAMPNTPLLLGMGTTALCKNANTTEQEYAFSKKLFSSAGSVYDIPEERFNEVINLNGSTPAYIYLFAKTIAEFGADSLIPFDTALSMVCDTLKGSAEMLARSGKTPDELIEAVSSPGGTTLAALKAFADTGFVHSLEAGMEACLDRAYELGDQKRKK